MRGAHRHATALAGDVASARKQQWIETGSGRQDQATEKAGLAEWLAERQEGGSYRGVNYVLGQGWGQFCQFP